MERVSSLGGLRLGKKVKLKFKTVIYQGEDGWLKRELRTTFPIRSEPSSGAKKEEGRYHPVKDSMSWTARGHIKKPKRSCSQTATTEEIETKRG